MVVQMAAKIPDVSSLRIGHLLFSQKLHSYTERDENEFDPQDRGEESHFPLGYFGCKFWTTFQDVPFFGKCSSQWS